MTLCDAAPLVAIFIKRDANHARCLAALPCLPRPLVTTWPCVTEAMYLLHKYGGHPAQDALWQMLEDGKLQIHLNDAAERLQMRALMQRYADTPMDLADASLVVAAETLEQSRIFTLDSDFRVYRLPTGAAFEIVP